MYVHVLVFLHYFVSSRTSKLEYKTLFYQHSTMLLRTVNVCKLRVHCRDVCNINPPTYISVNCVEATLNIIRSNVHKTVVSYKTVQSFYSAVALQKLNVISSPICKFLCFKKHYCISPIVFHLCVRYIPIRIYTINKITFILNTITTIIIIIIIIIILFNFNITIIIAIIITIIIKSTIVIIILSFVLLFFNISGSCVTIIFEFICVLFNYLFFIIYWLFM